MNNNYLIHVITDFGQDYNAGIIQHALSIFNANSDNKSIENINYIQYGAVKDFSIIDGSYKVLFACQNINPFTASSTTHGLLMVIDPTVGESNRKKHRKPIAFRLKNGVFGVAPDNGVITKIAEKFGLEEARYIDEKKIRKLSKLGNIKSSVWDGYYIYSAALPIILKHKSLTPVCGYENISDKIKTLALPKTKKLLDTNAYRCPISGIDKNGNITLDTNIFDIDSPLFINSFDVFNDEENGEDRTHLGRFYLRASYSPHKKLDKNGNSLIAVNNPCLSRNSRIELAASSKKLINILKKLHPEIKLKINAGESLILKPNYLAYKNQELEGG
ncbi:SAM-dependent chlorinase/fluorinase [Candidatus Pacearchaeota archaeon]|nr:SAM-dependent chlorinase/fluorinase [Candidatus Pacearchaeota archaeon]